VIHTINSLHVVFTLSNSKHLVLSDVRKFAKVTIVPTKDLPTSIHIGHLGPEPLEQTFTLPHFKAQLEMRPRSKIKEVLMDQSIVAGIGNIYSDEMLWGSSIHPLSIAEKIPAEIVKKLFTAMKSTLKKGIDFGGDSTSDYRDVYGRKGTFQGAHNAYRLTGKSCKKPHCGGIITRMVVGGRSAHFCPTHQKLFT
jgi:formamidopyrimidine-DNA glycosylase